MPARHADLHHVPIASPATRRIESIINSTRLKPETQALLRAAMHAEEGNWDDAAGELDQYAELADGSAKPAMSSANRAYREWREKGEGPA